MNTLQRAALVCAILSLILTATTGRCDDWPMRGKSGYRNPVSLETGAPTEWSVNDRIPGHNIRWIAELGDYTTGTPTVANGLVWVGTSRRDRTKPDAGVLMCFRESDGQFLYEYFSPRLPDGRNYDWPWSSLASSPLIEGGRMWFCTNRCDVVSLNIQPLIDGTGEPKPVWKFDLRKELGVVPRTPMIGTSSSHCSVASFGDWIYVGTNNSRHAGNVPAPDAPSLVCFHRDTGAVVWSDNSPDENIMYAQFGNPTVFELNGQAQVVIGQGDGWLRSFDCASGKGLWQFNMNAADAKQDDYYRGRRSYIPTAPVFHANRVFAVAGTDPESGGHGAGRLVCLDPGKRGDVSSSLITAGTVVHNDNSAIIWEQVGKNSTFGEKLDPNVIQQSLGGVAIHKGLVISTDMQRIVRCHDADTGMQIWQHDMYGVSFGTPLIVDDRIYVGNDDGTVHVLALSHTKTLLAENELESSIYCDPVFANGTLYVATTRQLWAIGGK